MKRITSQIARHFQKHDRMLSSIIEKIGPIKELRPDKPANYFFRLCQEIVGQQLAGKAAKAIFVRFQKLFPDEKVTPAGVLKIPHSSMRKAGLSNAKARYIRDLAEKVSHKELILKNLTNLSDEQVVEELIKVKGIGPWTAEMFLMFTLTREDVFSPGDLGIRKAIKKIYGLKKDPTPKQIEKISNKWKPYRTYACLVLWQALDD